MIVGYIKGLFTAFATPPATQKAAAKEPVDAPVITGEAVMVPMSRYELLATLHLGEMPASKSDPAPPAVASGVMMSFEVDAFLRCQIDPEARGGSVDLTAKTSFTLNGGAFVRFTNYLGKCVAQSLFTADRPNVIRSQTISVTVSADGGSVTP